MKEMNINERIEELIDAPWQVVKAAAESVNVEKTSGASWNDMAEEIASAEMALIAAPTEEKPAEDLPKTSEKEVSSPSPICFWKKAGIEYCLNCGQKKIRHADGSVVVCCNNPKWQS